MIAEIQSLVDQYAAWLKEKTTLRQVDDAYVEITVPYLDRHNDYLQIYACRSDGGYCLTDDGYIIDDLELTGCKLESPKRQDLLKQTLGGFGVQLADARVLKVHTSAETFAVRKHSLVQAMLAINDLFFLAAPTIESLFFEDVIAWFEASEIRYSPRIKFSGRSGYDHLFDFVIPKSRVRPERIIRAVNRPTKDAATNIVFAWLDTRDARPPSSKAYALLNDTENSVPADVFDALQSYDVTPVAWSLREQVRGELAA
ncbi:MAG: DUF1829 domain-containing protein [Phycisphaerales bacterium]|nr:DUF1829 domain-containing protein [Phycisphaerales bacterium]